VVAAPHSGRYAKPALPAVVYIMGLVDIKSLQHGQVEFKPRKLRLWFVLKVWLSPCTAYGKVEVQL
jgi:hypothetical protein